MTEITIQEISGEDAPICLIYGSSAVTRKRVHIRGTATAAYTLDLSTYNSKIKAVEGVEFYSIAGASSAAATITWSGTTLTFLDTGLIKTCVLVEMNQ
jgi:hypothetical protein